MESSRTDSRNCDPQEVALGIAQLLQDYRHCPSPCALASDRAPTSVSSGEVAAMEFGRLEGSRPAFAGVLNLALSPDVPHPMNAAWFNCAAKEGD